MYKIWCFFQQKKRERHYKKLKDTKGKDGKRWEKTGKDGKRQEKTLKDTKRH